MPMWATEVRAVTRNVVVTGAAGGMGREAVRQLAQRDVNVLCVDRDEPALKQLEQDLPAETGELDFSVADVTRLADVQGYVDRAVRRWGGLDGAFHIAGWEGAMVSFEETDVEAFDELIAVNARSVWYGMKCVVPHLLDRGGGAIVNTGSYVAFHGTPRTAAYGAAKHAVVGMTRGVAVELASRDVRVNVVAPGAMDTRMQRTLWQNTNPDDPEKGKAAVLARTPRGKLADPAEVAAVGVWLLLDAPAHLTGQVIPVDGARSA
jgi:meso-butanediol dehydrogenase / (S,S)-butanediol dehydrogenase / diacetyl reductase